MPHTLEGAEALSPGQWVQSARPEGAEALSPGQRVQSARPEGAEALSPGQRVQSARPEGAEALSPGQRPGYKAINNAPCKGKSFKIPGNIQSFCPYRAPSLRT